MIGIHDERFADKAESFKKPLIHNQAFPKRVVTFENDDSSFQGLKAVPVCECEFPVKLNRGDSIILDFGDHNVGYLHYTLHHTYPIVDAPIKLRFTLGEFPLEITKSPDEYSGWLGNGWLQNETRSVIFTPYSGVLERRYAFRYLKIERVDNADLTVLLSDVYADCVSAVDIKSVPECKIPDERLTAVYNMSLKTLRECEQDVFEDGPKRDRRLWIGDLWLQMISDMCTFKNMDLIKRCIYLFAAHRTDSGLVAPCLFPDSPPHVDNFIFLDYSLFFISCLYEYYKYSGDKELTEELYDIAKDQALLAMRRVYNIGDDEVHIDWCVGLDKSLAVLGVYIYTLKQLAFLSTELNKDDKWIYIEIESAKSTLMEHFSDEKGLFVTRKGQVSWHTQIWAVLAGVMSKEENLQLLKNLENENTQYDMRTPYMVHFYIDALYNCGLKEEAMEYIRKYWGEIVDLGFDCCPEFFNPNNHMESAYDAPEVNSACHAWSCTPMYWIDRYYREKE